jgi:hypothetical protein
MLPHSLSGVVLVRTVAALPVELWHKRLVEEASGGGDVARVEAPVLLAPGGHIRDS